jgi:hypothetical protein
VIKAIVLRIACSSSRLSCKPDRRLNIKRITRRVERCRLPITIWRADQITAILDGKRRFHVLLRSMRRLSRRSKALASTTRSGAGSSSRGYGTALFLDHGAGPAAVGHRDAARGTVMALDTKDLGSGVFKVVRYQTRALGSAPGGTVNARHSSATPLFGDGCSSDQLHPD